MSSQVGILHIPCQAWPHVYKRQDVCRDPETLTVWPTMKPQFEAPEIPQELLRLQSERADSNEGALSPSLTPQQQQSAVEENEEHHQEEEDALVPAAASTRLPSPPRPHSASSSQHPQQHLRPVNYGTFNGDNGEGQENDNTNQDHHFQHQPYQDEPMEDHGSPVPYQDLQLDHEDNVQQYQDYDYNNNQGLVALETNGSGGGDNREVSSLLSQTGVIMYESLPPPATAADRAARRARRRRKIRALVPWLLAGIPLLLGVLFLTLGLISHHRSPKRVL